MHIEKMINTVQGPPQWKESIHAEARCALSLSNTSSKHKTQYQLQSDKYTQARLANTILPTGSLGWALGT